MATASLTVNLESVIADTHIKFRGFKVAFDGAMIVGPVEIKPLKNYTFQLNPAEKLPFMLLIQGVYEGGGEVEKFDLTFADKVPAITIPPNATDKLKLVQTLETLKALPYITQPLFFFNNGAAPFPGLDKVTQLIFWNNSETETIHLQILKASTPGTVAVTPNTIPAAV